MAKANLDITSFTVDPKTPSKVADLNKPDVLEETLKPTSEDKKNEPEAVADLTPKEVAELESNPSFMEMMKSAGGDVATAVGKISDVLPKSMSGVSEFVSSAKDGNILESYNSAVRLKEAVPARTYNNIQKDVYAKTLEYTGGLTTAMNPIGDYLCKKKTNKTLDGFSLDKAIEAALKGAKLALASLNKCGFDVVGGLDELDVTEGIRLAIGLTVAQDTAKNGGLDAVGNITTRFSDLISPGEKEGMATDLCASFVPGESTLPDEGGTFLDTIGDLVPDFLKPGEPKRASLLDTMSEDTLAMVAEDDDFVQDASLLQMIKDGASDGMSMVKTYGASVFG